MPESSLSHIPHFVGYSSCPLPFSCRSHFWTGCMSATTPKSRSSRFRKARISEGALPLLPPMMLMARTLMLPLNGTWIRSSASSSLLRNGGWAGSRRCPQGLKHCRTLCSSNSFKHHTCKLSNHGSCQGREQSLTPLKAFVSSRHEPGIVMLLQKAVFLCYWKSRRFSCRSMALNMSCLHRRTVLALAVEVICPV